jgi:hypothetical protein
MVDWSFGTRKGAESSTVSTGNDLKPDFVSGGSLKFALEKSGNGSGPSYRKIFLSKKW